MTDTDRSLAHAFGDRYTIESEIGAGGMATVYLARDLKHDRMVALKVLRPELGAVLGGSRFLEEIRISARLDHPHILTLIDSGESNGLLWYVLPYVRGESLRQKLTREGQLSIDETVRIATQVASALDYAHRHGVIHRDIKPENILLHEGEAIVADFGIALAVEHAGGERLTETGLSLGTPAYMSPEQATGGRAVDARSDLYSLAAVVYEMLKGEPPHTGPTVQVVVAKLLTERPTRIQTVRATVPERMDNAIAKALAKVPADRFPGPVEFASALAGQGAEPGESLQPQRWVLAAGGAVAIALVLVALLWQPRRRPTDVTVAPPENPSTAAARSDSPSIAVLTFANLTGNPGDDYLSDGLTEEIYAQLLAMRGLKVISRNSSEALRGSGLTTRQMADTLGVRHLLEGSVRLAGDRIRVLVDLINATNDVTVWASTYNYDRTLADLFAMQEEIARNVADSLGITIGLQPSVAVASRTENPEAYEAYVTGRSLMRQRSRESLDGAIRQFESAIEKDSSYAAPYGGLSAALALWTAYNFVGRNLLETWGRALAMADKAIALDPNLAEAYAARGFLSAQAWGPAVGSTEDLRRAIALQPNYVDAHQWLGVILAREGAAEALSETEQSTSLDPLAPGPQVGLALIALAVHRDDVLVQAAAKAAALQPDLLRARQLLAIGNLLSGNAHACLTQNLGAYVALRANCLYTVGRMEEARLLIDSLETAFREGRAGDSTVGPAVTAEGIAEYYAWIGSAGEALAWLERAFALTPQGENPQFLPSALYDRVSNDPRFKEGLERLRAPVYDRIRRASLKYKP